LGEEIDSSGCRKSAVSGMKADSRQIGADQMQIPSGAEARGLIHCSKYGLKPVPFKQLKPVPFTTAAIAIALILVCGSSAGLMAQDAGTNQAAPASQAAPVDQAAAAPAGSGQNGEVQVGTQGPIAIVSLEGKGGNGAPTVTGALEVSKGKAVIAASGSVMAGDRTTEVTLPHRGVLRVCASTTVKLASDASVPAGEVPGLMMAIDHGAVEVSFATGRNADILMTPDFRILIGGPGAAEVKVRLGQGGDTCVDNAGVNAPYVLVTSVFDGGSYRVQPGQRVMFQHGSLHEVVDQEKEPCGCPPDAEPKANEFPLAQSEGLTAQAPPVTSAAAGHAAETAGTLAYNGEEHAAKAVVQPEDTGKTAAPAGAPQTVAPVKKKGGFFGAVGRFFKKLFGAE
jgi:hypothetical protein